jgi:hypothetical protein
MNKKGLADTISSSVCTYLSLGNQALLIEPILSKVWALLSTFTEN